MSDFEIHPVGTSDRIKELTTGLANMATRVAEVSEDRQVLRDRIKELEAQLAEQDHDVHPVEMAARIKELEAQLAKAEVVVRIVASAEWDKRLGEAVDLSCEYLAELEWQDNARP